MGDSRADKEQGRSSGDSEAQWGHRAYVAVERAKEAVVRTQVRESPGVTQVGSCAIVLRSEHEVFGDTLTVMVRTSCGERRGYEGEETGSEKRGSGKV